MVIVKINNITGENGQADYKGLDLSKIIAGSQIYPHDRNVAFLQYKGSLIDHEDVQVISEEQYLIEVDLYNNYISNLPPSPEKRIEQLENENADLWYDTMLKDARISEHDNEIAYLWYEIMTGGAA